MRGVLGMRNKISSTCEALGFRLRYDDPMTILSEETMYLYHPG